MKVLINALGIQDSGGITVLKKVLDECVSNITNQFLIVLNTNKNIDLLMKKYVSNINVEFKVVPNKGFLYRLYFENINFKNIVKLNSIDLIYNFSGTAQLFLKTPQLIKIQNLLFYTKKIDHVYKEKYKFILWLKQIYFKRIIFQLMANHATYFEIQSSHVKTYMSDFIEINKKTFFLKSDISIDKQEFKYPKKYDFTKKVKFLYIVGPHFEYTHKNFIDFTNAMLLFEKKNIDFEINITLSQEQLNTSPLWDESLNQKTHFLGYISDKKRMQEIFTDNTILISTSIIETLGLHVIEAVKNGIIPISTNEVYSKAVYGNNIMTYELYSGESLLNTIFSIISGKIDCKNNILTLQNYLKISENAKEHSIVDIFQKVIDVQK